MNNVERLKNYQNRNAATIEALYRAEHGGKTAMKLPDLTIPPKHGRKRPKKRAVKRKT
mgnify:CR=1 FL=1